MNDSFLVSPATAGGWDHIAGALSRLFVRLAAADEHFVIMQPSADYYVQVMIRPSRYLWTESVGDCFVPGGLDDEQRRVLAALGWNAPETEDRAQGNYWREWDCSDDALAVATFMVMTCIDVFGVGPRCNVSVEVREAEPSCAP